jgi:hypothetical protein
VYLLTRVVNHGSTITSVREDVSMYVHPIYPISKLAMPATVQLSYLSSTSPIDCARLQLVLLDLSGISTY